MVQSVSEKQVAAFLDPLFEQSEWASKSARLVKAIWKTGSLRISELSHALPGNPDANSKAIQRFLRKVDFHRVLERLFDEAAEFYIGDVTEIERPYAKRTPYVGRLSDGKTQGFQVFFLAQPYRGRAIPFAFSIYSEKTLQEDLTSRNLEQYRLIGRVKELVGESPLVLDREFSHLGFFEAMEDMGVRYVVRLKTGNRPRILDKEGKEVWLEIKRGERKVWRGVRYLGEVQGNIAGYWDERFAEPVMVFTNLDPERGLALYRERMKIEEMFRDVKGLLGLGKVMTKGRGNLEGLIGLMLLAYAMGVMIGEVMREEVYRSKKSVFTQGFSFC